LIGQLKTHLAIRPLPDYADVSPYWQMARLIGTLPSSIGAEARELLRAVGDVVNGDRPLAALDEHPLWKEAVPISLEREWPGGVAA
jgi:hypothetical protein